MERHSVRPFAGCLQRWQVVSTSFCRHPQKNSRFLFAIQKFNAYFSASPRYRWSRPCGNPTQSVLLAASEGHGFAFASPKLYSIRFPVPTSMPQEPSSSCRFQPQWLWLVLACGVLGSGWTGRAEASCGDYVLIGKPQSIVPGAMVPGAIVPGAMSGEHGKSVPETGIPGSVFRLGSLDAGHGSKPCHGPQCRQRNAPRDLPVPSVVVLERADACLNSVAALVPVLASGSPLLVDSETPAGLSGRGLYRPPRIA